VGLSNCFNRPHLQTVEKLSNKQGFLLRFDNFSPYIKEKLDISLIKALKSLIKGICIRESAKMKKKRSGAGRFFTMIFIAILL
jgi:hypothetical protein